MSDYKVYEKANFYIHKRYNIHQVLGKGSYGVVCSATDSRAQGDSPVWLAIKKVGGILHKQVLLRRAIRELRMMRYFRGHRNIISLVDVNFVSIEPYEGLYCFQELMEYDLSKIIYSSVQFSEFHVCSFIYQVLCGLKYVHSADVIHRDLKPSNLLVSSTGTVKIGDFGLARAIKVSPSLFTVAPITNYVATRWYRAPELIIRESRYGRPVDM